MIDASIAQCSTLRELILMDCTLDTEAIDALTNAFTSGMLQLTHLTWEGPCATDDHSHLLQAARQWLLLPPKSLVHLALRISQNAPSSPWMQGTPKSRSLRHV